ncbi:hypothetical protein PRZ48_006615 [Zasmidium cellare]|uniref:Uncharacterized protein n=1 Tax=Zasmidium cellare TaxID=395010 RepID=A0ABR0ENW0_ZASCE|nr:hypothetical protein PRZ48_006615 [Zasmidium cellare]
MVSHPPTFYNREWTMMWERQRRSTHNAASRLMRLPQELRDYIYELAVVEEKPIEVVELVPAYESLVPCNYSRRRLSHALHEPALAQVSTQLRREVLSTFYGQNTFTVTVKKINSVYSQGVECLAMRWLQHLSPENKKSLRKVAIYTTLSSATLTSGRGYSQLYSLADKRVCGGVNYKKKYASELRLEGWTWEGDVEAGKECKRRRARGKTVGKCEMHHHALVWTDMSSLPIRGADDNKMDSPTPASANLDAAQALPACDESSTSNKTNTSSTPTSSTEIDNAASPTVTNTNTSPPAPHPLPASESDDSPPPPKEKPTTFESLPPELRNHIYHLSQNLTIYQCKVCTKTAPANSTLEWTTSATEWTPIILHNRSNCCFAQAKHGQMPGAMDARIFVAGRVEPSIMPVPYDRELKLDEKEQVFYHSHPQPSALTQPPLTRVSHLVRSDTLPMFYGDRQFYFTMFSSSSTQDGEAVLKWLKTIGPSNAALLRNVAVVYARKQTGSYIKRELLAKMGELGVDVGEFGAKTSTEEEMPTPGSEGVNVAEPAPTTKQDISTGDVPANDKSAAHASSDAVSTTAKTTEAEKKKTEVKPLQDKSTGIVRFIRIPHPFCQCGWCVLQALRKGDEQEKEAEEKRARKKARKARKVGEWLERKRVREAEAKKEEELNELEQGASADQVASA